eukprot:6693327-Pyramimonas_sp.AAC.1
MASASLRVESTFSRMVLKRLGAACSGPNARRSRSCVSSTGAQYPRPRPGGATRHVRCTPIASSVSRAGYSSSGPRTSATMCRRHHAWHA